MDVDIESESCSFVAARPSLHDLTHVSGARKRLQAAGLVEPVAELGLLHAGVPLEPQEHPRVDRAGAGGHHQTLERREAHGGIDGAATQHSGERRAGAQMAGHDPEPRLRTREHLSRAPGRVCVREAVESVTTDAVSPAPFERDRVRRSSRWNRRMERRVEAGDARDARQQLPCGGDAGHRGGKVQRREVGDADEVADHVSVDPHRCLVARPAVHDAMPDRLDATHSVDRVGKLRLVEPSLRDLELAVEENPVVPVDQAQLDGARACVENEDAQGV